MDLSNMKIAEADSTPWEWEEGEVFSIDPSSEDSQQALLSRLGPEGCFELATLLKEIAEEDINSFREDRERY